MISKYRAIVVAGVLAAAVAVPVVASAADDDATGPKLDASTLLVGPGTTGEPAVQEVPADVAAAFAVLRKPAAERKGAPSDQSSGYGVNRTLARTAIQTAAGPVSVLPGNGTVCLRAPIAVNNPDPNGPATTATAVSCSKLDYAKTGSMVVSYAKSDGAPGPAIGLVPDGIAAMRLTNPKGAATTVPVVNNVWSVESTDASTATPIDTSGKAGESFAVGH